MYLESPGMFFRSWCDLHMSLFYVFAYVFGYVFALDKISASDWLRRQFLPVVLTSQSEVVCICTLSAFYHMAKQHSKGISTQPYSSGNDIFQPQ